MKKISMWLVSATLSLTFLEQIVINAVGDNRHVVDVVVVGLLILSLYTATLFRLRCGNVMRVQCASLQISYVALGLMLVMSTLMETASSTVAQNVVSFILYFGFSTLAAVILLLRPSETQLRRITFCLVGLMIIGVSIAVMQIVWGPYGLPRILWPDQTYYVYNNIFSQPRVNGLMGNPIEFGFVAAALYYWALIKVLADRQWVWSISVFATAVVIYYNGSRLTWVAVGIDTLWLSVYYLWDSVGRQRTRVALMLAGVVVALAVGLPWANIVSIVSGGNASQQASTLSHWNQLSVAITLWQASPISGIGLGITSAATKVITDGYLVQLLLGGGAVVLVLYLVVLMLALVETWRLRRTVIAGLRGAWVLVIFVHAIMTMVLDSAIAAPINQTILAIAFGVLMSSTVAAREKPVANSGT